MKAIYALLIFAVGITLAASTTTITVTGTVTEAMSGNPLIGSAVKVKGSEQKTTTDSKGYFTLQKLSLGKTLVVSHQGYVAQHLKIKNGRHLHIELKLDTEQEEISLPGEFYVKQQTESKHLHQITPANMKHEYVRGRSMSMLTPSPNEIPFHTEGYDLIQENIFHQSKMDPLSTFSIDVDAASYSNLRRMVLAGQKPPIDAVRIEEMINYFEYNYPQPEKSHPFSVYTELGECPWEPKHKLVHMGLQGKKIPTQDLPASNLVFLLDVSGSMHAYNKLPLVISSMKMLTQNLREQDRVAIVVYAGSSGLVLPSTSGSNKPAILKALDQLEAGGSTAGSAGIKLAYQVAVDNYIEGGNNRVILATDGDFNVGVSSDAELVRIIEKKRTSGVFLSVLGFGTGNIKDNKMQQLAQHGNGHHAYIDDINEARKVLVTEFGASMYTIAKDVKIQVEFNPQKVAGYRLIGYENRLLEKEDFNDDKKDAGDIGAGHTVTAIYEIIPEGVSSDFLKQIDPLKFQTNSNTISSKDWVNVKIRYKEPDGAGSKLMEYPVKGHPLEWKKCSNNFQWSAAVAAWGMELRESVFKGETSFSMILSWAKEGRGEDIHGYRQEMIDMVLSTDLMVSK